MADLRARSSFVLQDLTINANRSTCTRVSHSAVFPTSHLRKEFLSSALQHSELASTCGELRCGSASGWLQCIGLKWDGTSADRSSGTVDHVPRRGEYGATMARSLSRVTDDGFIRSKLAVFLSGGGSNFRALYAATLNNSIYGDVVVVISDKPGCKGCDYARENNLPVVSYPLSKHSPAGLSESDLVAALRGYGVDYVLLAGYLKILPPEVVKAFPRAILNIHPSLLPSFGGKGYYGMKVHEAVIRSGARYSGATIHFVDENFDTGPILAQRVVPVSCDDTPQDLAAKVLKMEHKLYPEAVAALCEDRILWREDGVPLIRESWNGSEYS